MARFEVVAQQQPGSGEAVFLVVDNEDKARPVARFGDRESAQAHADRLGQGPFDWDEQDAWKDPWKDDDEDGSGTAAGDG